MATLAAIRDAIKTTLVSALGAGVEVYDNMPSSPVLPSVSVVPVSADFVVAMGRGADTWEFDLIVLVPSADGIVGQELLDPYVSGAGSSSIRQAIFNARTLGLSGTDAHVSAMTGYGGRWEAAGNPHVGASLRLEVTTIGTA